MPGASRATTSRPGPTAGSPIPCYGALSSSPSTQYGRQSSLGDTVRTGRLFAGCIMPRHRCQGVVLGARQRATEVLRREGAPWELRSSSGSSAARFSVVGFRELQTPRSAVVKINAAGICGEFVGSTAPFRCFANDQFLFIQPLSPPPY